MEALLQHTMFTYVVFFILGAISSSAAFGVGFGAYLASRKLVGLASGNVSQNQKPASTLPGRNEIQEKKESPCGQKCKYFAKRGDCNDKCKLADKLRLIRVAEYADNHTQPHLETQYQPGAPIVSQQQHAAPEGAGKSEIQNGFQGGTNDCYAFCRVYNDTGKCDPSCPIVQSQ